MDLQERKQLLEAEFEEIKQGIVVRENGIKKLQSEINQLLVEAYKLQGKNALLEELLAPEENAEEGHSDAVVSIKPVDAE